MDDDTSRAHARELAKLGRAVRQVREERGLSERELADAVWGILLAGLCAIEAGTAKRSLDYARLIRLLARWASNQEGYTPCRQSGGPSDGARNGRSAWRWSG
jgi:hypothetical protein